MISPPSSQRLSTCRRMVFGERLEAARCSMKGRKQTTRASPGGRSFFQPHPGVWPVVQIAAVGGRSGGGRRCSRTVYLGSLRLENRPHHGTDHDSKSLPSSSRVRLPARPLRSRPAKHRSRRPAAGGLVSRLFGVSPAGTGLRSSSPAAIRVHSAVGLSGFPPVPHAARRVPELWRGRRGGSLVRWQAPVDPSLYAVSGPLGA